MALHSEDIANNMTQCEPEEIVNNYDTCRKSLRIKKIFTVFFVLSRLIGLHHFTMLINSGHTLQKVGYI